MNLKNIWDSFKDLISIRLPIKKIIPCYFCGKSLRVNIINKDEVTLRCPVCRKTFKFDCAKALQKGQLVAFFVISLLLLNIVLSIYLIQRIIVLPETIRKSNETSLSKMQDAFEKDKNKLKKSYTEEISSINPKKLASIADSHYLAIFNKREHFDDKYAITPREKAQLEMRAMAKDRTKPIESIIKDIATMAAPEKATISVYYSEGAYKLDIDFDMSVLSLGEEGTRTKHKSVASLKKEVIRLISKATNDVYLFCRGLDLASISVGCRHFVNTKEDNEISNTILYKICLDEKDLRFLNDNPFLNVYSTTQYFKVIENDFPNISISTSKD